MESPSSKSLYIVAHMKFVNMSKKLVKYSELHVHVLYAICRNISLFAGGAQQIVGGMY